MPHYHTMSDIIKATVDITITMKSFMPLNKFKPTFKSDTHKSSFHPTCTLKNFAMRIDKSLQKILRDILGSKLGKVDGIYEFFLFSSSLKHSVGVSLHFISFEDSSA